MRSVAGRDDEVPDGCGELLGDSLPLLLEHCGDVWPAVIIDLNVAPEAEVFGEVALLPGEIEEQDIVPVSVESDAEMRRRCGLPGAAFVETSSCSEC